jgi:hypothetical protein
MTSVYLLLDFSPGCVNIRFSIAPDCKAISGAAFPSLRTNKSESTRCNRTSRIKKSYNRKMFIRHLVSLRNRYCINHAY